jgi:hypothetical protein
MPKQPLALRIHTDPAYAELVRIVGYQGTAYPFGREEAERLNAKYGTEKMAAAAEELLDRDTAEHFARLKPGVRLLCRQLLGPTPDERAGFYDGVEKPPPISSAAVQATGNVQNQSDERELLQQMHGRKLRELLFGEHKHFTNHPPGDRVHEEAVRRMNLIEPIMTGRGQKVPPRPAVSSTASSSRDEGIQDLAGTELMQRYFAAKRILEEENELSAIYRRTKTEYDLLRSECHRRKINLPPTGFDDSAFQFTKLTTHRLRELLDMNQSDLTKSEPDSVTFQEALRDIGFIEAELRRRDRKEPPRASDTGSRGR